MHDNFRIISDKTTSKTGTYSGKNDSSNPINDDTLSKLVETAVSRVF